MIALGLSEDTITSVIDNPSILGARLTHGAAKLEALGIETETAGLILEGYMRGFRIVFIVNAMLSAIATVVSVVMIHHKELTRGDEEQLRAEARKRVEKTQPRYRDDPERLPEENIEMPVRQSSD